MEKATCRRYMLDRGSEAEGERNTGPHGVGCVPSLSASSRSHEDYRRGCKASCNAGSRQATPTHAFTGTHRRTYKTRR